MGHGLAISRRSHPEQERNANSRAQSGKFWKPYAIAENKFFGYIPCRNNFLFMNKHNLKSGLLLTTLALALASGSFATPASAQAAEWHIQDNATGGDCSSIGTWDISTKTCTLTQDLNQGIVIDSDNTTLDGNGHTVTGTGGLGAGTGIYLSGRTGVTIENLNVSGFSEGILLDHSSGNTLTDNTANSNFVGIYLYSSGSNNNTLTSNIASNNSYGIAFSGSNNTLTNNTTSNNSELGIYFAFAFNNTLINNTTSNNSYGIRAYGSSNNTLTGNTIFANYAAGIHLLSFSNNNQIFKNNFINNSTQTVIETENSSDNIFNLASPVGGNYWSNFDEPSEGCSDINGDNFCDAPHIFTGGQDNLPWTTENGWLAHLPENSPPTLSFPETEPYAGDGIDPNTGDTSTQFTFRVIYTDADNDPPSFINTFLFGHATTTIPMSVDTTAEPALHDGNYANGEQYIATGKREIVGTHYYTFLASDGNDTVQFPSSQSVAGLPLVIVAKPNNERIPVIIVPGILGSELYRDYDFRTKIWPPFLDEFPFGVEELSLTNDGLENPIFPMRVGGIVREAGTDDYYGSLIEQLKSAGYVEGSDLFIFSYDWRLNNMSNVLALKQRIDAIGAERVDVVAHSMGGLIAKLYMRVWPNTVRTFVDIATPHFGAPAALRMLVWGADFGYDGIFSDFIQEEIENITVGFANNMPSVYQLLPSRAYVDTFGSYLNAQQQNGERVWLDYAGTMDFLASSGGNTNAQTWSNIHDVIDDWDGEQYGVLRVANIAGCETPTPALLSAFNNFPFEYSVEYKTGDGTVPLVSANALLTQETYYAKNADHGTLGSREDVRNLILHILEGGEPLDFFPDASLTRTKEACKPINGSQVTFHSPIELHIYDEDGNHVGPTPEGFIEHGIPGVVYDMIEDNKFAFLPDGGTYAIRGLATDIGSFNARIKRIIDEEVAETIYYNEIPLTTPDTNVEFDISPQQTDFTFHVDQDGDGEFESEAEPSAVLNAEESADITKPITEISTTGLQINNGQWYAGDVSVSLTATDDNSGVLKTEYSLDGGQTWNIYSDPFPLVQEGTTTILYFSTDRAGNYESLQSKEIKIDKTPPEAEIYFELETQTLRVKGNDNLSEVAVTQTNEGNYVLADEAGHTLKLDFGLLNIAGKQMKAELKALQYDNRPAITLPNTNFQYEWAVRTNNLINQLIQRIKANDAFDIRAQYNSLRGITKIDIWKGPDGQAAEFSGLVILKLITNAGNFDYDF